MSSYDEWEESDSWNEESEQWENKSNAKSGNLKGGAEIPHIGEVMTEILYRDSRLKSGFGIW